jgi:outer membrane protein
VEKKGRVVLTAFLLLVTVVSVRWGISRAAVKDEFGLVDMQVVAQRYMQPALEKDLEPELQKLQKEFDAKAKNASDQAKAELFTTYQGRLNAKEEEMLESLLAKVSAAASQVMKERGMTIVCDKAAVVAGGTDITSQVLAKLKVK